MRVAEDRASWRDIGEAYGLCPAVDCSRLIMMSFYSNNQTGQISNLFLLRQSISFFRIYLQGALDKVMKTNWNTSEIIMRSAHNKP
jgi:hypothetical protein